MRRSFFIVAIAAAFGAGAWWLFVGERTEPVPLAERFRLVAVERATVEKAVTANGTLNPVTVVNVGTQISGRIRTVNTDFNEVVKKGQVLAELDSALIEAQLAQLEANLGDAQTLVRLAQRKLDRSEELVARGFISGAQRDDERFALESAQARARAIEAQIGRERTNLGYTVIRSPIDGIVIARSVDVGQTVAASFQTPTLFMIARDLRDMQIDTNVAEADVGALREGLSATFRVDALGDRSFDATVRQVRLNPKLEQNVVTYNVVLSTRNDDGRLLPGMTAAVRIKVASRTDVLRVPNTALRFRPSDPLAARERTPDRGQVAAAEQARTVATDASAGAGASRAAKSRDGAAPARRAFVHVESSDEAEPILVRVPVAIGISDGTHTEIVDDGSIRPGERVAVGELVRPAGAGAKGGSFRMKLF